VRLVPLLVARLREDEAVAVRAAAAMSLGRFILLGELEKIRPGPHAMAYEALLTTCQTADEHVEVRRRALESLAYIDNETVAGLIRQAYAAPEEKMRVSAVFAMGRSADTRWARQVQQELFSPNPELRYEAARACGELQLSEAVRDLEELADEEILEYYCLAEDEATRSAAEAALDELEFLHGDLSEFFTRLIREPDW